MMPETIELLMKIVSIYFVSGAQKNEEFIPSDPNEWSKVGDFWFQSHTDNLFPATKISPYFFACYGPNDDVSARNLISMVTAQPIRQIVAVGEILSTNIDSLFDFYPYQKLDGMELWESAKISIKYNSQDFLASRHGHSIFPKKVTELTVDICNDECATHLTVTQPKSIPIVLIPCPDMEPLELQHLSEAEKDTVWFAFTRFKSKCGTLVHCRGGIGRTGCLIMTFYILGLYEKIAGFNPFQGALYILNLLNFIRASRPGMVQHSKQLTQSIFNAHVMYEYGCQRGYIQKKVTTAAPLVSYNPFYWIYKHQNSDADRHHLTEVFLKRYHHAKTLSNAHTIPFVNLVRGYLCSGYDIRALAETFEDKSQGEQFMSRMGISPSQSL